MALINKIREKSGLAVTIIALGLGLFLVGGDLLQPNSTLLGNNRRDAGSIAGHTVSFEEYTNEIAIFEDDYRNRTGRAPSENDMASIRERAWLMMITRYAFGEQYDKLGIEVTNEEHVDMVQGRNIDPNVRQQFTDPNTGQFDRNQIVLFLQNLDSQPAQLQYQWALFENQLKESRLRMKHDNLLVKANYATSVEGENLYLAESNIREAKYVFVPFTEIPDEEVTVSDADLKQYLKGHSLNFQTESVKTFEYVTFPIQPSAADTAALLEDMEVLKGRFTETNNDSSFAVSQSESNTPYRTFNAQMQEGLSFAVKDLAVGEIIGPMVEGNVVRMYKISAIDTDTARIAHARHILIAVNDEVSDSEARQKARGLLEDIQNGEDFAQAARTNSDDNVNANRGGDLFWAPEGKFEDAFDAAIFGQSEAGLINRLVKTSQGYHIIEVLSPGSDLLVDISTIEREVLPSRETQQNIYREVSQFRSLVNSVEDLRSVGAERGISVRNADARQNDYGPGLLRNARPLVGWMFREGKVGEVSDIYEFNDEYVVAAITGSIDEGTNSLEKVRPRVEAQVRNEKKAAQLIQRLQGAGGGSLDDISGQFNNAQVYTQNDIRLNSSQLPGAGTSAEAVGALFALQNVGDRTPPIETVLGVVVVELVSKTDATEIADYSAYTRRLADQFASTANIRLQNAVQEGSSVEDERYKIF